MPRLPGYAELADWLNPGLAGDTLDQKAIAEAAKLLQGAERPLILYGPSMVSGRNAEANRTA